MMDKRNLSLKIAIAATTIVCLSFPGSAKQAALAESVPDDYIKALGGKVDYWHPEKMPLKVWIIADPKVPNYKPEFKDFFQKACQSWSDASQGKIKFRFVQGEPYDIKVSWTNDLRQLLQQGELGESSWENDQDGLFRAYIKLLTVNQDGSRPITAQEAKLMCLHEIGHALGLVKHSPYLGDIMNACIDYNYNTPVEKLDLSERDKKTILRLYTEGDEIVEQLSAESSDPHVKIMRLCFRASKLLQDEKYDAAYVLLDRALKLDPNCAPALNAMASCCFEQGMDLYTSGNYEAAAARLERVISIMQTLKMADAPQYSQAKDSLARCKAKLSGSSAGKN